MKPLPLVSIIVNNYNYARFLSGAIDSALGQSYPRLEIIVVDDGSTDSSAAVITSYGDRIIPLLKENGGQASALNAGFAQCHGELVIFLDADDLLLPHVASAVVEQFQHDPDLVRVQYRLQIVDAGGLPTGHAKPPPNVAIPSGDLVEALLCFGDDIPWLPTSGNAFSAAMLKAIMPIPEDCYRICADYYLSNLSPLYGLVGALDENGGSYRVHDSNQHQRQQLNLRALRELIVRTAQTHTFLEQRARQIVPNALPSNGVASQSVTFPANRLVSLRLDAKQHPIENDTRSGLFAKGIRAAWHRTDLPLPSRILYILWFMLASITPAGMVKWLAEQLFFPESRVRWFDTLLSRFRQPAPQQALHHEGHS